MQAEQTCDFPTALNDPHGHGLSSEGVQQGPGVEPALVLQPWREAGEKGKVTLLKARVNEQIQ